MREGFVRSTISKNSCGLCKWHTQRMLRSGRDPIYEHFCQHNDAARTIDNNTPKSDLQILLNLEERGVYIGKTSDTPSWCPIGEQQ